MGEVNSSIAFLGENSVNVAPLVEFASSFKDGEISHYIFRHETVAGLLVGIPAEIRDTEIGAALEALVGSTAVGIEVAKTNSAAYKGISALSPETPLWRISFSGDGEKPRLTLKSAAADVAYNVPVYVYNSDNVVIAGAGMDMFYPKR